MNTKKMQVLFIEQTGHILAAFTRTAAAESRFDVKSLAAFRLTSPDLIVRNEKSNPLPLSQTPIDRGEILSVPVDLLKAEIIELNEKAFVMPFNFIVGGGQANDLRGALLGFPTATLDKTTITIDCRATVPEATKVWAQVQEKDPSLGNEPIRRIVAGIIVPVGSNPTADGRTVPLELRTRPDEQPAAIPKPTATMKYSVLVLVAGRPPGFLTSP